MTMPYEKDALTDQVIGLAIEVHRHLGPGLLESAYEECLCYELNQNGIVFKSQVPLPVVYKSVRLDCGYRIDIVVEHRLILELKTTERLMPIHEAQVLTYMRLSGLSTVSC
jgi:GxxExxY protein